ncbi:hypothetical protein FQN57_002537 [Myotisia sp. PD_48]|nr:hypothetical protein FQN57_002537 [Myotisia sp. PD_48]
MSSADSNTLIEQISSNLANIRYTFGTASPQYQAVLKSLQTCILQAKQKKESTKESPAIEKEIEGLRFLLERELQI